MGSEMGGPNIAPQSLVLFAYGLRRIEIGDGMVDPEPSGKDMRESAEHLQQPDWPIVALIVEILRCQRPGGGQAEVKFGIAAVFATFRSIHRPVAQAAGDQHMEIAFRGRQNVQDVDMHELRRGFVNYLRHRTNVALHMRRDQFQVAGGFRTRLASPVTWSCR